MISLEDFTYVMSYEDSTNIINYLLSYQDDVYQKDFTETMLNGNFIDFKQCNHENFLKV